MAEVLVDSDRHDVLPMPEPEGRAGTPPCPCLGADAGLDIDHRSDNGPWSGNGPGLERGSAATCPALNRSPEGTCPALSGMPSDKCPTGGLVHWEGNDSLHESE